MMVPDERMMGIGLHKKKKKQRASAAGNLCPLNTNPRRRGQKMRTEQRRNELRCVAGTCVCVRVRVSTHDLQSLGIKNALTGRSSDGGPWW